VARGRQLRMAWGERTAIFGLWRAQFEGPPKMACVIEGSAGALFFTSVCQKGDGGPDRWAAGDALSFSYYLYLMLHICIQKFVVMFLELNRPQRCLVTEIQNRPSTVKPIQRILNLKKLFKWVPRQYCVRFWLT
jgi:hypothetical protein